MTESNPQLDAEWIDLIEKHAALAATEFLHGNEDFRLDQKSRFEAGEDWEGPIFDYPNINLEDLDKREEKLLEIKANVKTSEPHPIVRQAYLWKLNEKIATVRLLRAAKSGDMHRFKRYNEFIYGKPDKDIFSFAVQELRNQVFKYTQSPNQTLSQEAVNLLTLLPENLPTVSQHRLPNILELANSQQLLLEEVQVIIDLPVEPENQTDQIKLYFDEILKMVGAHGWTVVVDESSRNNYSINQELKQVIIPPNKNASDHKLRKLGVHEIGTHVARRLNGEESRLGLLGIGLDRYDDEGIATTREQVLDGLVEEFPGEQYTLSIGLAYGLDGTERNPKQVYEIMKQYFLVKKLAAGNNPEKAEKNAKTNAWNNFIRTYRGTDGKTPGVCMTKDLIYEEGNLGMWWLIRNGSTELQRLNIGRYDPKNQRHIWILNEIYRDIDDIE